MIGERYGSAGGGGHENEGRVAVERLVRLVVGDRCVSAGVPGGALHLAQRHAPVAARWSCTTGAAIRPTAGVTGRSDRRSADASEARVRTYGLSGREGFEGSARRGSQPHEPDADGDALQGSADLDERGLLVEGGAGQTERTSIANAEPIEYAPIPLVRRWRTPDRTRSRLRGCRGRSGRKTDSTPRAWSPLNTMPPWPALLANRCQSRLTHRALSI